MACVHQPLHYSLTAVLQLGILRSQRFDAPFVGLKCGLSGGLIGGIISPFGYNLVLEFNFEGYYKI